MADVSRGHEVWNNAIGRYEAKVLSDVMGSDRWSAKGTARLVTMETTIFYADDDELIPPNWKALVGTPEYKETSATYKYVLELDRSGAIIGGRWLSFERPDFLWLKNRLEFTGYWSNLNVIYRPAALPVPAPVVTPAPTAAE